MMENWEELLMGAEIAPAVDHAALAAEQAASDAYAREFGWAQDVNGRYLAPEFEEDEGVSVFDD